MTQKWYAQDASTHQIWNSYFKEYRSYAPDLIPILETRSEYKVTDLKIKRGNLPFQDAFTHKFGILISNKKDAPYIIILKMRSKVTFKVTVTRKCSTTLHHPKMHSYTKFGIPSQRRDILETNFLKTRPKVNVKVTQKWYVTLCYPKIASTHKIWESYLQ